jgi:predicted MFS family arabinose efflux permease
MAGVLCFVFWIFARDFGAVIAFTIIQGTICGTFFNTVAPVGAEVVGLVELPSALSIAWISIVLPGLFGEPIALQLKTEGYSGDRYLHAQIFAGCMFFAASICLWFVRSWKIRMNQQSSRENESTDEIVESSAIKGLEDKSGSPVANMRFGLVASSKNIGEMGPGLSL